VGAALEGPAVGAAGEQVEEESVEQEQEEEEREEEAQAEREEAQEAEAVEREEAQEAEPAAQLVEDYRAMEELAAAFMSAVYLWD
jgi:hypothetical protein